MVVLAVAVFVTLSSYAVGCSRSTNSVSVSFVSRGWKPDVKFIHYAAKFLVLPRFNADRTVLSFCHTELIKRIEHYIKTNYSQSRVTNSSLDM